MLERLDACPGGYDLRALRTIVIGGAAAPESLVRGLEERHGLAVAHLLGHDGDRARSGRSAGSRPKARRCRPAERHALRMKPGVPGALLELRVRNEDGEVPWDGDTMGELEVRGAYVASAYYRPEEDGGWFTADGWFRTGDIATIDPRGYLEIRDRTKDLIKSGGEWISSVALEGALMGHPAVAEAAVVAVPHPRWLERPLAAVVLREGRTAEPAELLRASARAVPGLVAPRRHGVRAGHPAHVDRQIPQVRASRLAARALRRLSGPRVNPLLDLSARPVIAHRGASAYAPENTLPAFELAVQQGADAFELDVRLTRDGAPVVIHDDTLERTTDLTGPVRARTLAELRAADAGHWFTPDGGRTMPFRGARTCGFRRWPRCCGPSRRCR